MQTKAMNQISVDMPARITTMKVGIGYERLQHTYCYLAETEEQETIKASGARRRATSVPIS
jgi:hypothetical protein